eukprot:TRINITY_DN3615_c1_g1_i3.p1 TRINITY_DN3615_c1_g1~~TRINITY_DN3615_c1_g1_i3.p1  ORF type:complete len:475 (+),score=92.45 TRINITY_DN3615_c1_g1_i3:332-1756(+)
MLGHCSTKMPGLTMVAHETKSLGCNCNWSRSSDQLCHQDSKVRLSSDEANAAEESLSVYCKPVELYDILQHRAFQNRSFLQRCLHYKIEAERQKRIRSGTGNVIFNYKYYHNTLQKTEVTEDFSCPFCLVRCASFKGLRYHLISSHDLFEFEFWVTEDFQAVNVSVKTDSWRSEIVADQVDPRLQTFLFCSKRRILRRSKNQRQNVKHLHAHVTKLDSPEAAGEVSHGDFMGKDADGSSNTMEDDKISKTLFAENHMQSRNHKSECCCPENPCSVDCMEPLASSSNITGASSAVACASDDNDYTQLVSGSSRGLPPQFAKTRKSSIDRADPRNYALLQKRQFFHSHRAQRMALEQVFADRDSEDEVDDNIADFEDRRLLDDFLDVTKDEKQIMHLWNSFVRKQRVLADGHIPWACEAFSKLHGRDLICAPALIWCWRLFMIKLWNHNLLDASTMNNCNIILQSYLEECSDPMQS